MYSLVYSIHKNIGSLVGESADEMNDRICTIMNDHYDDHVFDEVTYECHFTRVGDKRTCLLYEETARIMDANGNDVGFYSIKKV